jgi:TonB family protein
LDGGSGSTNNRLKVSLTFESPVGLENAFVVLDMNTDAGKALFLWGIGTLRPGDPSRISVALPSSVDLGASRYFVHVFSNGAEVLNSTMDLGYINAWYESMMRKRIEGVTNQALGVMVHPSPIYPPALKKRGIKGKAVISVNVTSTGFVLDAALKSATDPAFGQAALVAVRQWWFLPPIKDGVPSGTRADIPINFN